METKVATDERFYTPRSSARRGYSSAGSEDERFLSPRTSARSVSSDDNDYTTPREGSMLSPRDATAVHPHAALTSDEYYSRAMGKPPSRSSKGDLPPMGSVTTTEAKHASREFDYKAQAFGGAKHSGSFRVPTCGTDRSGGEGRAMVSPRDVYVEAPAVLENDIFSAARHNRIDSVAYMLDQGTSVNLQDAHGNTVLAIACQNGLKRMAKLALRRGANINAQNHRGNTALHFCFAYGYGDSLGEYLISKGADTAIDNDDGLSCFDGIDPRSPRK